MLDYSSDDMYTFDDSDSSNGMCIHGTINSFKMSKLKYIHSREREQFNSECVAKGSAKKQQMHHNFLEMSSPSADFTESQDENLFETETISSTLIWENIAANIKSIEREGDMFYTVFKVKYNLSINNKVKYSTYKKNYLRVTRTFWRCTF